MPQCLEYLIIMEVCRLVFSCYCSLSNCKRLKLMFLSVQRWRPGEAKLNIPISCVNILISHLWWDIIVTGFVRTD